MVASLPPPSTARAQAVPDSSRGAVLAPPSLRGADFTPSLAAADFAMSFTGMDAARSLAPFAEAEAIAGAEAPTESLAVFPSPRVRAWQVGLLRPDRLQHAGLSFTLGAALTIAFQDRVAAAGLTLALGAGKEWWDSRRGRGADAMDLAADALGLGLALVAVRGRAP